MAARDLLTRARGWLAADRARAILLAGAAVVVAAATVWFLTARDDRGRTATLTADAWYYHAYLPSLVLDRDLDFTNEYKITRNWYRFGKTPIGRPANVFGIGPAVFELPFFVAGHGLARAVGAEANGFSRPEVELSLYASVLASLGALLFGYRLLRRRLGGRYRAALVPLVVACAGPVVYYAIRQPGYAHPFATFWVAWFVDAWDASYDRARPRSLRTWLGLGALIGAAALARPQCGLWAILLAHAALDDLRAGERRWTEALRAAAPRWAAGAAVAALVFLPQPLAWRALYGGFLVSPQGEGFMRWDAPAWSEVLFASRNGLFPWAPLQAIAAVGLLASVRRTPRLSSLLIAGVALQAVVNGAAWDWWAGGSFGGRRFDSAFIAFAYGFGFLAIRPWGGEAPPWRLWTRRLGLAALAAVAAVLVAGNLAYAGRSSAPTVRIYGGAPAAEVLRKQLPRPLGRGVAPFSAAANLPARALFAWRHGTDLGAYDRVVGVHVLGELYPGLNSFKGRQADRIPLDRADVPRIVGAHPGPRPKTIAVGEGPVRVLLGLNRRGPVDVTVRAAGAGGEATVQLRWNGTSLGEGTVGPDGGAVQVRAPRVRRGVNVLEILAPPGTTLSFVDLLAPHDELGRPR